MSEKVVRYSYDVIKAALEAACRDVVGRLMEQNWLAKELVETVVYDALALSPNKRWAASTVSKALNRAANCLEDRMGDEGPRDAVNLVVNAAVYYLENPDKRNLEQAIEEHYSDSPDEVLDWITG